MASTLSCVGFRIEDEDALHGLVRDVLPRAAPLGEVAGVSVLRWQDDSGARLLLGLRGHEVVDLLPSFDAGPGALLDGLHPRNDDVWAADVVDADGLQVTWLTAEVEERRWLRAHAPWSGPASVVALGVDVSCHADAAAFDASGGSLLGPASPDEPPPPRLAELGITGPPRLAAEPFMSLALFDAPEDTTAHAMLSGTVLSAERRTNSYTGAAFVTALVRTVGFEATVCLSADEHDVPEPGGVVSGTVFLVASTGVRPHG